MALLTGMKDIQKHVNMSEATVLMWIREAGFPAKKVGGIWISETEAINRWCGKLIESEPLPQVSPVAPSAPLASPRKKQKSGSKLA